MIKVRISEDWRWNQIPVLVFIWNQEIVISTLKKEIQNVLSLFSLRKLIVDSKSIYTQTQKAWKVKSKIAMEKASTVHH